MEPQVWQQWGASRPAPVSSPSWCSPCGGSGQQCPGKLRGWDGLLCLTKRKQDIPEALGIPHSARDKKHGAHGSPGTAQDPFLVNLWEEKGDFQLKEQHSPFHPQQEQDMWHGG